MAMYILLTVSNILCFVIGAMVGQKVARNEVISLDPIKAVKEHKTRAEAHKAQERMEVIMENMENYDGSSIGQRDVPRG